MHIKLMNQWFRIGLLFIQLMLSAFCMAQSSPYLDSLLKELKGQDPDIIDIDLMSRIALLYTDIDPAEGLKYARDALSLAQRRGDLVNEARAYNSLASNWLMHLEMDSALMYYGRALSIYKDLDDKKGMGDIIGNMGQVAYQTGRYDEALSYFLKSLTAYEDIDYKSGIINQHASIGNTYMLQRKYNLALHHDSLALHGFAALGDSLGYGMVLGNMANIFADLGKFERAAGLFREATAIFRKANEPLGMARNLINLTAMYNDEGQYAAALESGLQGLTICRDNHIDLCVRYCLSNVGFAYLKSYVNKDSVSIGYVLIPGSDHDLLRQAIDYLEQSATYTRNLESPRDAQDIHLALSMAYKFSGHFEKALEHHERYAAVQDSLSSVDRTERIEQLTTEREIAVRDKQIELDKLRLKVKRSERIYFIIGLILLSGWLSFVYRNARNQRKANLQLGELNTQISNANLQLENQNSQLTHTLDELKSTQAQLIEAERQKENEILRRRISRDIHDDISSGLSKITWMSEILRKPGSTQQPADLELLDRIASYSRDTVSKLGEIIWSTKPESDTVTSLVSYCREFLHKYLDGLSMRTHVDFPDSEQHIPLNPELRRNLYLVLKESVHNAVKYSKATDLHIGLSIQDGAYHLVVEDNGAGMDVSDVTTKGNGLRNMQTRMQDVHGTMTLQSSPGKGTRLEFTGQIY